jgi:predicted dehydrogenase
MTAPYRAAVIGLGRMGSTFDDERTQGGVIYLPYCHTPAYVASPRTELVGGADPHEEQRSIYGERWGTNVYADHRELLEKEKPDIVSVCTSARVRPAIIEDVARSGAKAIWAEKPLAFTLEEADRVVAVCAENDVTIAANCSRRWNPHYQSARALIDAGEIGELQQITAYYLCNLSHNGSHGIDTMRYLANDGNVSWLFGEMESDEAAFGEDDPQGNGYLVFDNGMRGFLRSTPCGPIAVREFDVLGTEGRIRILENALQFELWKTANGPGGSQQPAKVPFPYPKQIQGMGLAIIDDIMNAAENGGKPLCSGADARDALEVALALRESHRRGFVRVDLPLEDRSLGIISVEAKEDDLPARVRRLQTGATP